MKEPSAEQFLKDVSEHEMTVLLDNGVHRHIVFAKKGEHSWHHRFTITTWPWHLCISGDMGTYVFLRIEDMFQFFRTKPREGELFINVGYWAEKVVSVARHEGLREYDENRFHRVVKERFDDHEFETDDAKDECWDAIEYEVLTAENEYEAHEKLREFENNGFEFSDSWEIELKDYTYHYVWCCYAIAWAIRQYDKTLSSDAIGWANGHPAKATLGDGNLLSEEGE